MKNNPNQFTTLPNDICKNEKIGIAEVLVYLMCKQHINGITNECFPSYETLAKECECSRNKVMSCIKTLNEEGFIQIEKKPNRKSNFYKFPKDKEQKFQMIALDLLSNEKLTGKEKSYLSILQQHYIINKDTKTGEVSISNLDLMNLTKVSSTTL